MDGTDCNIQHYGLSAARKASPAGGVVADIGGSNPRVGVIELKMKKGDLSKASVWKHLHWRHRDDQPSRENAVDRMAETARELVDAAAEHKLKLAPFFGIGCPGLIDERGIIRQGGQNLSGNWEGDGFNLAQERASGLPRVHGHEPLFVIHNDAVIQGLSEVAAMQDVSRWGIFTIGMGLGNARFTNRAVSNKKSAKE